MGKTWIAAAGLAVALGGCAADVPTAATSTPNADLQAKVTKLEAKVKTCQEAVRMSADVISTASTFDDLLQRLNKVTMGAATTSSVGEMNSIVQDYAAARQQFNTQITDLQPKGVDCATPLQ